MSVIKIIALCLCSKVVSIEPLDDMDDIGVTILGLEKVILRPLIP